MNKNIKLRIIFNAEPEGFKLPKNFKIVQKISMKILFKVFRAVFTGLFCFNKCFKLFDIVIFKKIVDIYIFADIYRACLEHTDETFV